MGYSQASSHVMCYAKKNIVYKNIPIPLAREGLNSIEQILIKF